MSIKPDRRLPLHDYKSKLESYFAEDSARVENEMNKARMQKAVDLVNMINKKYNLNLLTVDASAMTDDIFNELNK